MKKYILPTLIALSALAVSGSAAFYSVYGLSKLFAGASLAVIIMAGSLEISKLVAASLLYQYWDKLNKALRTYLVTAVVTLVLITSMGIYGFLSNAYQTTYSELLITENEQQFLEQKASMFQEDVVRYDTELQSILSNITVLSQARSSQTQVRDVNSSTGVRTITSTVELRIAQDRIKIEEQNRTRVQQLRQASLDSLRNIQQEVLLSNNSSQASGELGPLQYLSGLTGYPMDKIINILLLVIIFVFDPLAIALVIAANFAFKNITSTKHPDTIEGIEDDFSEWDNLDEDEEVEKLSVEEIEKMERTRDSILEKSTLHKALDKMGDPKIREKYENLSIIEAENDEFEPYEPYKEDWKGYSEESKIETNKSLDKPEKDVIFKDKMKGKFQGGNFRVQPKLDDNIIDYN
jgi:hypothetical protein